MKLKPQGLKIWQEAIPHLTRNIDGYNRTNGVSGAHNINEFKTELINQGGTFEYCIMTTTPHPDIKGIYTVEYRIPSKDPIIPMNTDNLPVLRSKIYVKTIYDPALLPDNNLVELGKEAIENIFYIRKTSDGKSIYPKGKASNGLIFNIHIYDTNAGEIKSFYPIIDLN